MLKAVLKATGFSSGNLKYDEQLSQSAYISNFRLCNEEEEEEEEEGSEDGEEEGATADPKAGA